MFKILSMIFLVIFISGCNTEDLEQLKADNNELNQKVVTLEQQLLTAGEAQKTMKVLTNQLKSLQAEITTTQGKIMVRFYPEKAPLHVMNFVLLSETGFYNGVKFHRVIKNFMIQGGDPNSKDNNPRDDGTGGTILNLPAEFNDIHHAPGVLSMARSQSPNSASSQFFIMHADNAGLDNKYTVFGEVIKGQEVVDKIANSKTINTGGIKDRPAKDVTIKNIRIYEAR